LEKGQNSPHLKMNGNKRAVKGVFTALFIQEGQSPLKGLCPLFKPGSYLIVNPGNH
jgi:hypothetical protein